MQRRGFLSAIAAFSLFLAPLLLSTAAQAQTQNYNLAGAFVRGEGGLIRLPNIGLNQNNQCKAIDGTYRLFAGVQNTTPPFTFMNFGPPPNPITIPLPNGVAPLGCVPGPGPNRPGAAALASPVVVNTFAGTKASFMLPNDFFSQPEDNIPNRRLVPNVAAIISLSTDMPFNGPETGPIRPISQSFAVPVTSQNTLGIGPPPATALANWNNFREGAWSTQTGRAGVNFTWCNGNPACVNIGGGGGGLVRYTNPDPNGFGGTASVILSPGDTQGNLPILSALGGLFGGTPNNQTLLIQPVQAPITQGGAGAGDMGGKGYRAVQPAQAAPGKVYGPGSYMISAGGYLTTFMNLVGTVPGTTNTDHHFPWTTGRVTGRNIQPTNFGSPQTFTWRFSGTDSRTAQGQGNIQLVAGSMRFSTGRGTLTPHINGMQLAFLPVPEPGLLGGMLAAGGLLGVAVTRRRKN